MRGCDQQVFVIDKGDAICDDKSDAICDDREALRHLFYVRLIDALSFHALTQAHGNFLPLVSSPAIRMPLLRMAYMQIGLLLVKTSLHAGHPRANHGPR